MTRSIENTLDAEGRLTSLFQAGHQAIGMTQTHEQEPMELFCCCQMQFRFGMPGWS